MKAFNYENCRCKTVLYSLCCVGILQPLINERINVGLSHSSLEEVRPTQTVRLESASALKRHDD